MVEFHPDPVSAKAACRRDVLQMRNALSLAARERKSHQIWERFLDLPELSGVSQVLLYAEHNTEVLTLGLIERLAAAGKSVALPVVVSDSPHLLLRKAPRVDDLTRGAFGIKVPPDTSPQVPYEDIELAVLPGVAFDSSGWRVGYGGGFYDRLLAQAPVFSVGFAFDCQILPSIPVECHDEQLDVIITESRTIRPG